MRVQYWPAVRNRTSGIASSEVKMSIRFDFQTHNFMAMTFNYVLGLWLTKVELLDPRAIFIDDD